MQRSQWRIWLPGLPLLGIKTKEIRMCKKDFHSVNNNVNVNRFYFAQGCQKLIFILSCFASKFEILNDEMNISAVIPTCNRKSNLLALLKSLNDSLYPLQEVIIVDSGKDRLSANDLSQFDKLQLQYLSSEK